MREAMEYEERRRYHQEVKNRMRTNKNNIGILKTTFNVKLVLSIFCFIVMLVINDIFSSSTLRIWLRSC